MPKLKIAPPIVQVAIDVLTIDAALRVAEAAVAAGVDWLEVGTPLVTFAGVSAIGALAKAFPGVPVLADYKIMDGARKYVIEAGKQGGRIATVCAQASDATVRAAVQAGQEAEVAVISDLYNAPDVAQRAAQIAALGVDSVYIHWGADQRTEQPERDPLLDLPSVLERVSIPVGVGTFSVDDGVRAFGMGADIAVIGVPIILADDVESGLRAYVERGKAAYKGRG
jgi:3-hexulose-6-phosphate synthase/6-phospho-3-hexuloisomerase